MVLKMVLKILLLKDKKKDKKFVKLLIILIMAFKIWKKIVNLVLFSSKQKILGLLGGIEIRYWNLVLVFSLGKKPIHIFNTTFKWNFVNLMENYKEHSKISSISRKISSKLQICVKMKHFDGKNLFFIVFALFSRKKMDFGIKNTIFFS